MWIRICLLHRGYAIYGGSAGSSSKNDSESGQARQPKQESSRQQRPCVRLEGHTSPLRDILPKKCKFWLVFIVVLIGVKLPVVGVDGSGRHFSNTPGYENEVTGRVVIDYRVHYIWASGAVDLRPYFEKLKLSRCHR